jgi:hypothetical protein
VLRVVQENMGNHLVKSNGSLQLLLSDFTYIVGALLRQGSKVTFQLTLTKSNAHDAVFSFDLGGVFECFN